jgi:hypothetical protein
VRPERYVVALHAVLGQLPKQQWKNIRTTNVIERLNGEFRRRLKTQGSLPSEDAALVLLLGLIATGQIKLRKIDGHKKLAGVISEQMRRAAARPDVRPLCYMENRNQPEAAAISNSTRSGTRPHVVKFRLFDVLLRLQLQSNRVP